MPDYNPQRNTWRRLKRNKGAVAGLMIILLSFIVALIAHIIAPDGSPDANRMILEIGGQKPGFTQTFILIPKERKFESSGFLRKVLKGIERTETFISLEESISRNAQVYNP